MLRWQYNQMMKNLKKRLKVLLSADFFMHSPSVHLLFDSKGKLNTHWMAPELEDCGPVVETIPDLYHVSVTAGQSQTFSPALKLPKHLYFQHKPCNILDMCCVTS